MQHRLVTKQNLIFGLLQRFYTLSAGSSQRWAILNAHIKSLSLKPFSETRWEGRVASVKAVKHQLSDICYASKDLAENTTDFQLVSECHSIEKEITTYEFVVSLVIWYEILTNINAISKMWLCENMHLDVAIQQIDAFTNWLDNYRENGFQSSLVTAREIAEENDIDRQFKEVRRRRQKRHFDYEGEHEAHELNAEEIFKINYFYVIVDNVRASCHPSDSELLKQCSDLQISVTVGESYDTDGHKLYEELNMFIRVYEGNDDIISVLKDIIEKKLTEVYPTIEIVLRIIATRPVTVEYNNCGCRGAACACADTALPRRSGDYRPEPQPLLSVSFLWYSISISFGNYDRLPADFTFTLTTKELITSTSEFTESGKQRAMKWSFINKCQLKYLASFFVDLSHSENRKKSCRVYSLDLNSL
ncbi:hypothetical protein EVAR_8135_1 [Eumeta japonica]|uniref:Uncharacterized protein n=1 Tax=Eumeta variegata TaxID=151549 RepID=A0A4C1TSU3_EUMVA|nr:hypothetical protein EVAR_8135_1 [Eumeta japonica]